MTESIPTKQAGVKLGFDYIPGLDGLRAVAILIVLVAHLGLHAFIPGGFGVTLFFFISGMLISRLLLAEHDVNGHIGLGRFYLRRLFRLYPAAVVAIACASLVFWAAGGTLSWGKVLSALFYYANYYGIAHGFSQGREGFDPFAILWSLAVEEQYYVFFPLVCIALASRRKQFAWLLLAAVIATLAWRVHLHHAGATSDRIYMGTDTRIDSILYGALLTLILARDTGGAWLRFLTRYWMLALAILGLLASLVIRDPGFRDTWRYTLQGLALMPLITAVCFSTALAPITRILETRPARKLGAWSYSLYLFHPVAIVLAEMAWGPASTDIRGVPPGVWAGFALSATGMSFVLALVSHAWVELPFLKLRRRFGAHIVNP